MTTYSNPFYNAKFDNSKPVISTDAIPVEYKGYLIYERIKKQVFDIVKDGECVGMCAGINGAKKWIDTRAVSYKEQTLF